MSDSQKTEDLVLQVLVANENSPLDADKLIAAVQEKDEQIDAWAIKKAVWRLTAAEKAEFTNEFHLRLPAHVVAAQG